MNINIYKKLQNDMKLSMKEHNDLQRDCLRGIISEIKNLTLNAGKEINDDTCMSVLKRQAKLRNDSIKNFTEGNRLDLADREKKELSIIEKYLPKMLSEELTQILILLIINEQKIELTKKNFGMIMKQLPKDVDKKIASLYLNIVLK